MTNYNNNNRNNSGEKNTNTRSFQFYMDVNDDWASPSTMVLGYWNNMISLKLHPALDSGRRTSTNVFDYEQQLSTALNPEKANILADEIDNVIIKEGLEGEEVSRAVTVGGGSTLIIVGVKKFEGKENLNAYLMVARIGDDFKPTEAITYVFNPMSIIKDYNPQTGDYGIDFNEFSELQLFSKFLRASVDHLTMGTAHATRTVDRYFRDKLMEGLGVSNVGGGGGQNNRTNRFEDRRRNQSSAPQQEELTNADDISGVMG